MKKYLSIALLAVFSSALLAVFRVCIRSGSFCCRNSRPTGKVTVQ